MYPFLANVHTLFMPMPPSLLHDNQKCPSFLSASPNIVFVETKSISSFIGILLCPQTNLITPF